ncbi:hypothetical protein [Ralstonia sp. UBA689]|uniref:PD-(D/E)XK nuclease domain-containing protein n=1 Tax=Ralstonia sp. UBA689 TaxID=1947373 RepID=UPI0025D46BB9|nr:hypothetical protein [Ralstonia sp. UBA689]
MRKPTNGIPFDDVRPEEWTPSYAGGASRVDFLLPEIEAVVEIKKMRSGLSARQLGEQLIVDIARYKKHPTCEIAAPNGRSYTPASIKSEICTAARAESVSARARLCR